MVRDEKPRLPSDVSSPEMEETRILRPTHGHPLSPGQIGSPSRSQSLSARTSSRKREREDDISPRDLSRGSSAVSAQVHTPQLPLADASDIGRLHLAKNDQVEVRLEADSAASPGEFRWNDLLRAGHLKASTSRKISHIPIPRQDPITLFPAQFGWPPVTSSASNGVSGHGPSSSGSNNDRIAIDPALSSVRSSVGQPGVSGPPDMRFIDETLASATASPGALDAAMMEAAAAQAEMDDDGNLLDPGDGSKKDQPFSRSPELRVSHKLAERKRRKEMKDLFDELRELLPAERGTKSSKWEILSKAIDFITQLKSLNGDMGREIDKIRRELDVARGGTGAAYHHGGYQAYQIPSTYPPPGPVPYPPGTSGAAQQTSSPTAGQGQQTATPRSGG